MVLNEQDFDQIDRYDQHSRESESHLSSAFVQLNYSLSNISSKLSDTSGDNKASINVVVSQLNENIEIMSDLPLTPQEVKDLKLGEEVGMTGMYCDQCGTCSEHCSKVADIPTLMRSYMYAFGYNNLLQAKDTFDTVGLAELACDNCDECIVNCKVGFDVKDKLQQIYEIRNIQILF